MNIGNLIWILVAVLIIAAIVSTPTFGQFHSYGWKPSVVIVAVAIIVLVLFSGRL